jgi:hypothetical protein
MKQKKHCHDFESSSCWSAQQDGPEDPRLESLVTQRFFIFININVEYFHGLATSTRHFLE